MKSWSGIVAGVIVCGLLAAEVPAQTPRSYRSGKEAVEAKRWPQAEQQMRQAIAEDPEARRRTFTRYTPYYYLGVALAEQGDCRGAIDAWQLSDRYGALREGGDEARDLERRRERCRRLVSDVQKVVETTREALAEAEETASSLDRLSRQETLAPLWADGFAARAAAAREILGEAQSKLQRGDAELDLDLLAEAGYQAAEAQRAFDATLKDATSRLTAVNQAVSGAMTELDAAEKQARSLLRTLRKVAPYPKRLGSQVAKVRRALSKSEKERDAASAEQLAELTEALEAETRRLRPLAAPPPAALQDAGAAYLAGDFQGVIDLLADHSSGGERQRFHALLLEAAALFGLYVTGGESDAELLERTRAAIRELAAMDPSLGGPGERFFSPRFRALYAEVFGAAASEAAGEAAEGAAAGDGAAAEFGQAAAEGR